MKLNYPTLLRAIFNFLHENLINLMENSYSTTALIAVFLLAQRFYIPERNKLYKRKEYLLKIPLNGIVSISMNYKM